MRDKRRAVRLRVGRNVRRLRQSRGLSQEQLAELAGTGNKHIGQVERAETNVGLDVLAGVADALAVDVAELFTLIPRRRRAEPPLFLVTGRELQQMEAVVRAIRSARMKGSGDIGD